MFSWIFVYHLEGSAGLEGEIMAALFFDIDGTLISELTGDIPESAREALHSAKANGIRFLSIQAGLFAAFRPLLRLLGLTGCCAAAGLV